MKPHYPWRPSKIDPQSLPKHVRLIRLSQDEYDLIQAYGNGASMEKISHAFTCNKSTICRALQNICKKLSKPD